MMARSSAAKRREPVAKPQTENDVDLGWLGGTVGFYLRTAQEAAFQAFARRVGDSSARPWRFAILALIDANPGLSQVAISRALRRDTSSLTPVLDELCNRGWVIRERVAHNRRSYALNVSAEGKKGMRDLMASAVDHERELDRLVGREHRAEFIRTLQRIATGLAPAD
jgi:DNA-binding MarR family transcriptional regulator